MEANGTNAGRRDMLTAAISDVLQATLESKQARQTLEMAFPHYDFNDNADSSSSILASLKKTATDIAITRLDELLTRTNTNETLGAIDAYVLRTAHENSTELQTPLASLPESRLKNVVTACKKTELEKLEHILQERMQLISNLNGRVSAHVGDADLVRGRIANFSQGAEEVFHMALDVNE